MRAHLKGWRCAGAAVFLAGISVTAVAKLPPPSPEQVDKAAATEAKAKEQAEIEKENLARAQDRVVAQYRKSLQSRGITPPTPTPVVAETPSANIPNKAVEPPRTAGPHGGTTPSAEAHSGNAK